MPRDLCQVWKDKSCGTSPHVAGSQRHRVGGGDRGCQWWGVSAQWGQFQFGTAESSGDDGGAVLNREKVLRSLSPTLVRGHDGSPPAGPGSLPGWALSLGATSQPGDPAGQTQRPLGNDPQPCSP